MNNKRKLIMTSVLVFALIAIVVSTLDINKIKNVNASQKSEEITETMNNSSQQTNENEDITSEEDSTQGQSEENNTTKKETETQSSVVAAKKSVDNSVSSKQNNQNSTTSKSTASSTQPKPSTSSSSKQATSSSSYKKPSTSYTKPSTSSSTTKPSTSGSFAEYQQRVLELVNQERAAAGLNPLTFNSELSSVATKKSQDMADLNYFDHTSPTYGSPFDMMKQFGIKYNAAGENIAKGQTSPEQVMEGWMNSPGHRANILNANFTQLGVGIAKNANGQLIWTQMFIG